MEKRYYLAYGSNLNVRQMMMRCPSARIIGTAKIKDYKATLDILYYKRCTVVVRHLFQQHHYSFGDIADPHAGGL